MTAEANRQTSFISRQASDFFQRVELPGDALLFLYFAVLVRQCLWFVTNDNLIAWLISTVVGVGCAFLYVLTKTRDEVEEKQRGVNIPFWLIVVLPIVIVYLMRVVFPDTSFDVLNYRIFHSERSLRGLLFLPGEFFPTPAPYNPTPDMVTGIFRHALGYRLGTIANLLVMIWVAQVSDKLLRPFLNNAWVRACGVLLAVSAEHLLFEINNYMADLLALPLVLEATYLALFSTTRRNSRVSLPVVRIALLLGISVTFKLTNASVALPIVLFCAFRAFAELREEGNQRIERVKRFALTALLSAVAFVIPLLPFSLYLYRETGSPVFPVFNGIFKSLYWPPHSIWDPRWGPVGIWEKLFWPIIISFKPERLSELAVYSGRISLGFIVAIIGFVLLRDDRRLRELFLIFIAACLFWSASTGYIRYALYLEVLATLLVFTLGVKLVQRSRLRRLGFAIACLLFAGLTFQMVLGFYYISQQEWSQRPTLFEKPGAFRQEARHLFRDRSLRPFVDAETLKQVDDAGVWIGSSMKTTAIMVMLRPDIPTIGISQYEYVVNPESRLRLRQTLKAAEDKRMFSLVLTENLGPAKLGFRDRGLIIVKETPVEIPYYSPQVRIGAALLELKTVKAYNKENAGK